MARRAPRRPERARRRLPVVPATLRRPLRRRRVPDGPHPRRRAPALGHAARRSRSRRVDARPSRALRRGDARRRASATTRSSSPTTTTTCPSPRGCGGHCVPTATTPSRCSTAGITRWTAEGRPLSTETPTFAPRDVHPSACARTATRRSKTCSTRCSQGRRHSSTPGWTRRTTRRAGTSPALDG